jgi:peptidyl-prolyl cis-trans isomerase A (cyclophilin A)
MARNKPGTASSEIFICINDQPELDYNGKRNPDGQGFAAFGRVKSGMEVVKMIQRQSSIEQILIKTIKVNSIKRI